MRQSVKSRVAVNSMIEIAMRQQTGPVVLAAIAKRQHVSLACLGPLLARLLSAGLVERIRGPGGGYTLAREPEFISLAAILAAIEADAPGANWGEDCHCLADDLSQRLDAVMHTHMAGIALADLVRGHREPVAVVQVRPLRRAQAAHPQARPVMSSSTTSAFEMAIAVR